MENISEAPEMFQSLTRPELDTLYGKMQRAARGSFLKSRVMRTKATRYADTARELDGVARDLSRESERRIAL